MEKEKRKYNEGKVYQTETGKHKASDDNAGTCPNVTLNQKEEDNFESRKHSTRQQT